MWRRVGIRSRKKSGNANENNGAIKDSRLLSVVVRVKHSQFLRGYFDYLSVAHDVYGASRSGVLFHRPFDGRLERHQSALVKRQFENIWRRFFHLLP
jgi:hypothetical protein